MTKPLSPAAQALLDAYGDFEAANIDAMAAALRVVTDQELPEEPRFTGMRPCGDTYSAQEIRRAERMKIRQGLLVIAAELEAQ